MSKEKLLISSCLVGKLVKYNGSHNILDDNILKKLKEKFELFPFCPEVEGGLPTPRVPCEIITKDPLKVLNKNGIDKTKEFISGANKTLELCNKNDIKTAILKSNSPSCSNQYIYDGTFSSKKILSKGVTSQLLENNHIKVINETQINTIILQLR